MGVGMQNVPAIFWFVAICILVFSITWHEMFHAFTAKLVGQKIKSVHIGLPYKPMARFKIRGLMFTISPYMLGGGVKIDDEEFDSSVWWKRVLVAIMGPVGNLILALVVAILMFGLSRGVEVSQGFVEATVQATGKVVTFQVPWYEMVGPMGLLQFMARVLETDFLAGVAFCMILLNIALAITNLIPLPAMDGGLILTAIVSAAWRKANPSSAQTILNIEHRLRQSTYYVLLFGVLVLLVKDALFLLASRMGWF
jgi:membrane-associated protease RseP (regulator of RpoE activity)